MNSSEISRAVDGNRFTKSIFRGVFACDKVPRNRGPLPALLMVDTDDLGKSGSH